MVDFLDAEAGPPTEHESPNPSWACVGRGRDGPGGLFRLWRESDTSVPSELTGMGRISVT